MHLSRRTLELSLFLAAATAWILLFLLPWSHRLQSQPWLHVALALFMFGLPGFVASMLLVGDRFTLLAHALAGLALSVFLVDTLGLLGRVAHLPFAYIRPTFAIIGLACIAALLLQARSGRAFYKPRRYSLLTLALLALILGVGTAFSLLDRLGTDDIKYLAYVTTWQHAPHLSFNLVYTQATYPDSVRFWLAMFPMNLALLADFSGLHGLLLIGFYLEPFLVSIAVLSAFSLYEALLPANGLAIGALLLQFVLLILLMPPGFQQPGQVFFFRLTEDKAFAAFILAPVFFATILVFLDRPAWDAGLSVLLVGLSLSWTHPIMLAYSVFIAGLVVLAVTLMRRQYRTLSVALGLLAVAVMSSAWLRLVPATRIPYGAAAAASTNGASDRITFVPGTRFYGFNLDRVKLQTSTTKSSTPVQAFFSWTFLWLLALGVLWSVFSFRRYPAAAAFIGAAGLLVILSAIPYTGWLVGYFVSSRMLWRSPWFFPLGTAGALAVGDFIRLILQRIPARGRTRAVEVHAPQVAIGLASLMLLVVFVPNVYARQQRAASGDTVSYEHWLNGLASLGEFLEGNIPQPSLVAAPRELMDYLPGLSSKSKGVAYNLNQMQVPYSVEPSKLALLYEPSTAAPLAQRLDVLQEYGIRYILTSDRDLMRLYTKSRSIIVLGRDRVSRYWILDYEDLER